jgi:hypothetical protein
MRMRAIEPDDLANSPPPQPRENGRSRNEGDKQRRDHRHTGSERDVLEQVEYDMPIGQWKQEFV